MKTANVKVRVKDVKAGVTAYRSHPVYGIEKIIFMGKPYQHMGIGLFVDVMKESRLGYAPYVTKKSLCDAGITPGKGYNGRRTFFKLKHAQEWQRKWATDLGFIRQQADHEEMCQMLDDY